jgi:hypothetical protein
MKTLILRSTLALAAATVAFAAHADHKLFPTDVLGSGQVDVSGELGRMEADAGYDELTVDYAGVSMRFGVGSRTHIGFGVVGTDAELRSGPFTAGSADATTIGVSLRHALIQEGNFSLAFDGSISRTDIERGDDLISYGLGLSAGWKLSSGLRPYVTGSVIIPDEGSNSWKLEGGVWVPVAPRVTLIPALTYARTDSVYVGRDTSEVGVGLSALFELGTHTYLRPGVAFASSSDDDTETTSISLQLHHQF